MLNDDDDEIETFPKSSCEMFLKCQHSSAIFSSRGPLFMYLFYERTFQKIHPKHKGACPEGCSTNQVTEAWFWPNR